MRQALAGRAGFERPSHGTCIPAERTGLVLHQPGRYPQKRHAQLPQQSLRQYLARHSQPECFQYFLNGQSLFYSSGHHTSFTDIHGVYCHRATRAHNTILVNGMGQRIGTEGYGWIPRYYVSDNISYVAGDASNAYGKVISPLWLLRGEQSNLNFPRKRLGRYRSENLPPPHRNLRQSGYSFIYDELEAEEPVTWSYLLHTVTNPMNVDKTREYVHIRATSKDGASDAYLFSSGTLETDTTSRFFVPAVNWLRADEKDTSHPIPTTGTSPQHRTSRKCTASLQLCTHMPKTMMRKTHKLLPAN